VQARNPYQRGRLDTVGLLVLTSLDDLLLKFETLHILKKTRYINEEVNRTELSLQKEFPACTN
jgi:hypothetical protein